MIKKDILKIGLVMVLLCLISVALLTLPSIIPFFDLTTKAKTDIATTVSGLTAPIIGIVGSILLYLALTKQIESNDEQRAKNEIDFIFQLFARLEQDITNFTNEETTGPAEKRETRIRTGALGLDYFAFKHVPALASREDINLFQLFELPRIGLIVNSAMLLEQRLLAIDSRVNLAYKTLFIKRLDTIYEYQLMNPLEKIISSVEENPNINDGLTNDIKLYVTSKQNVS